MQSQAEQQKANAQRISAYREKLTEPLKIRAKVADQVRFISKKYRLTMAQYCKPIQIALKQLECGCSEDQAYALGADTARIIALANTAVTVPDNLCRRVDAH